MFQVALLVLFAIAKTEAHPVNSTPASPNRGPINPTSLLLFVTTHFSDIHLQFLETCWPAAVRKSQLLRQADVLVFGTGAESERSRRAVAMAFNACKTTRVIAVPNPGKLSGAMLPLQTAEQRGWFRGYEWVMRLNPDVIVRDDAHLRRLFARSDLDALFARCPAPKVPNRVHTDFAAWRPKKIVPRGAFAIDPKFSDAFCGTGDRRYFNPICNPELAATRSFTSILASGRYAWLQGKRSGCRVDGPKSFVVHNHAYVGRCNSDLEHSAATYLPPRAARPPDPAAPRGAPRVNKE